MFKYMKIKIESDSHLKKVKQSLVDLGYHDSNMSGYDDLDGMFIATYESGSFTDWFASDWGYVCGLEVTLEDLKNMDKHKNSEFKANITAYKDVDGVARIEYKDHIIQIYGYVGDNEMINNCYFIIDENSQDVCEKFCIVEAFQHIDKLVGDV